MHWSVSGPLPSKRSFTSGALSVEAPALGHAGDLIKRPDEVLLGYPAAHGHLQPGGGGDQVEHLGLGHLELLHQSVQDLRTGLGEWCRRPREGQDLSKGELLGKQLAMPLVQPLRHLLEANVVEEVLLRPSDEDLDRVEAQLAAPLPLPGVPALLEDGLDMRLFELDADEEPRGIVDLGIGPDEQPEIGVYPDEERRVHPEPVLPDAVPLPVIRPVLDLEAVLVSRPILRQPRIREKGVADDAQPLARRRLERDPERRLAGAGALHDLAALADEGLVHEGEQRLLVAGARRRARRPSWKPSWRFVPKEDREKYSALSEHSLFYFEGKDFKHKILAIVEEEGAQKASYALKLLQSEGEITIASTGKDPATGKLVTQEYRVEGPVMIFLTTTAVEIDEELLNRCLVLTVDEGREQTRRIHELQRRGPDARRPLGPRGARRRSTGSTTTPSVSCAPSSSINPYAAS